MSAVVSCLAATICLTTLATAAEFRRALACGLKHNDSVHAAPR